MPRKAPALPRTLRLTLALSVALVLFAAARAATAHQLGRSYCSVRTVPGGIDVVLETSAEHLAPYLRAPPRSDADLLAGRVEFERVARASVEASTPAGPCSVSSGPFELSTRDDLPGASTTLHFACPAGPVTLKNQFRLDVDPQSEILCAIDGSAWAFRRGAESKNVGTPPTLGQVLVSFVKLGVHHVFSGIDHILFVIALLLAAARASREHTLKRGLGAMATVVTGFTLGHSVTLIAAGLDLIRIEPRITESIIALSIVVVGTENVLRDEIRWRGVTATLFGLVHGFGFASVLAQTELPRRGALAALVSFNVGIELAQLTIVLAVFPALAWAARRAWYEKKLLRPVSLGVALLAGVWLVKRVGQLDFLPWLGS